MRGGGGALLVCRNPSLTLVLVLPRTALHLRFLALSFIVIFAFFYLEYCGKHVILRLCAPAKEPTARLLFCISFCKRKKTIVYVPAPWLLHPVDASGVCVDCLPDMDGYSVSRPGISFYEKCFFLAVCAPVALPYSSLSMPLPLPFSLSLCVPMSVFLSRCLCPCLCLSLSLSLPMSLSFLPLIFSRSVCLSIACAGSALSSFYCFCLCLSVSIPICYQYSVCHFSLLV